MEIEFLEPDAFENLSFELSEQKGDVDLFVKRFEELQQKLEECLSENWQLDNSGLEGDFFLDGEIIHGCDLSVGLVNKRIINQAFLESLVNFLNREKSHWIISLKWPSFDGAYEGLGGRAFIYKDTAYFDLAYTKESYGHFITGN